MFRHPLRIAGQEPSIERLAPVNEPSVRDWRIGGRWRIARWLGTLRQHDDSPPRLQPADGLRHGFAAEAVARITAAPPSACRRQPDRTWRLSM